MGSAYLSEILTCEGDCLVDINTKISEIIQQTNSLKNDVRSVIDEGNINLNPFIKENIHLENQAKALINEMTIVQEKVKSEIKPELSTCTLELNTLSRSLQEINMTLYFLNQLLEIYSCIKSAKLQIKKKQFHQCAKLIANAQELIRNGVGEFKHLELYKTLSNETIISYEHLLHEINELWSLYITFDVQDKGELKIISFGIDINYSNEMTEILKALDCFQYTIIEKKFISNYLHFVINEIITQKVTISEKVNEKAVLTLEILNLGDKPHYYQVFHNLGKAISFLKCYLNLNTGSGINFLQKIGTSIGNELADKLIKNCLSETIPTSSEDLEKYNNVVSHIEELEIKLKECGFLPEKSTCLIDYARNINVLFANKFCQSYLEKARKIMKKDLHNITSTEDIIINKISTLPTTHQNILKNKLNIQESVLIFPKCQISKSADELMELINSMVQEMLRSQDLCAVRLFYTIRNTFEMYSAIVPLHHKKFLDTLPQQVALFHNNCIYFTHFLISLTCECYKKAPFILNDHFNILLEEAVLLRTLAAERLELHVTSQKNQLIYILRDSGIATLNENPRLDSNSDKSVRQCIRQLQILQSVWKDVLPIKVYNRAIGFLLNSVIEEIMSLIMAVEDISSQTASELASMFTIVVERTPSLFPEPKEIFRHVRKWQKFNEFIVVLKGSLRDIDERWSNGMGPLANEFTTEQVKHLIRALFQNSERRAALLSRIK